MKRGAASDDGAVPLLVVNSDSGGGRDDDAVGGDAGGGGGGRRRPCGAVGAAAGAVVASRFAPVFAGIFVNIVFGGYSVVTAAALTGSHTAPIVYAFLRDAAASAVLLSAAWAVESRRPAPDRRVWVDRADVGVFVLIGLLMVYGAQGMSAMALANIPASYFSLLSPLMPVVTLAVSLALRLETFRAGAWQSWAKVVGLLVCVAGAVSMGAEGASGGAASASARSRNWALGNLYLALQLTLGGSFPAVQKTVLGRYPALTVAAWGYAFGTGLLSLSVLTCCMDAESWDVTPGVAAALGYSALLASALK
jgi:drug/metabolite transporter (DMT)-like permease